MTLKLGVGLKRTEIGAFIKDYDDPDKESDHAVQMTLTNVASEDPRYAERPAPSLSEEFPEGKRVFFLGDHAYGTAAQVSATDEKTLSVILAVSVIVCFNGRCLISLTVVFAIRKGTERKI